jgi:hypothetical protein
MTENETNTETTEQTAASDSKPKKAPRKPRAAKSKPAHSMSPNEQQFSNGRKYSAIDDTREVRPGLTAPYMTLHNGWTIPFYDGLKPMRDWSAATDDEKRAATKWGKAPDGTPSEFHNEDGSIIDRATHTSKMVGLFGDIADETNRCPVISVRLTDATGKVIEPAERIKPTAQVTPMLVEGPVGWTGGPLELKLWDDTVMQLADVRTLCFERDAGPIWYGRHQGPSDLATFFTVWSPMRPIFDKMGNAIVMRGGQDHISGLEMAWTLAWMNPGEYDWDIIRQTYENLAGMTFAESAE